MQSGCIHYTGDAVYSLLRRLCILCFTWMCFKMQITVKKTFRWKKDSTLSQLCVWKEKRNGEKPSFTMVSRCENCSDLCPDPSCLPNRAKISPSTQVRSAEGGCETKRYHTPVSQQWINSASSVNLSRRFQCVVNKSLIQAKVPDAAGIPFVSWKSLWTWLQLCHQISGKVRRFMAAPCQKEVILIEQFHTQKWRSFFLRFTSHCTGMAIQNDFSSAAQTWMHFSGV